ncbi:YceI family protein [Mucilaginibacter sp. McL0603]|uniref:YceI family protein n=1 Tax=Mucilaginibacter sp. McL0603 TaxID=3415670 RepID=UPI003CE717DD
MKKILAILTTLLLLGGMLGFTQTAGWRLTKENSVKFSGKGVDGIFKKLTANVTFDEKNLQGSKFVIAIDVASLNTGNALQNKHATGSEWFDAAKYPQIKFTTNTIEKVGNDFVAKGKMEVKGKANDVNIPFAFTSSGSIGKFTSKFSIKRTDYGIGEPTGDVADVISIEIVANVTKQ